MKFDHKYALKSNSVPNYHLFFFLKQKTKKSTSASCCRCAQRSLAVRSQAKVRSKHKLTLSIGKGCSGGIFWEQSEVCEQFVVLGNDRLLM